MAKRKPKEPSVFNLILMAIYHLRKLSSMEGNPETINHHLKAANDVMKKINQCLK